MDNEFWFRRLRFPFDEKDLSPAELEKLRLVMETRQEVKDAYTRLENARNSARMVYTVRMYKHSQEMKKCLEDISYLEEKLGDEVVHASERVEIDEELLNLQLDRN